jgi:hypothetical protein
MPQRKNQGVHGEKKEWQMKNTVPPEFREIEYKVEKKVVTAENCAYKPCDAKGYQVYPRITEKENHKVKRSHHAESETGHVGEERGKLEIGSKSTYVDGIPESEHRYPHHEPLFPVHPSKGKSVLSSKGFAKKSKRHQGHHHHVTGEHGKPSIFKKG